MLSSVVSLLHVGISGPLLLSHDCAKGFCLQSCQTPSVLPTSRISKHHPSSLDVNPNTCHMIRHASLPRCMLCIRRASNPGRVGPAVRPGKSNLSSSNVNSTLTPKTDNGLLLQNRPKRMDGMAPRLRGATHNSRAGLLLTSHRVSELGINATLDGCASAAGLATSNANSPPPCWRDERSPNIRHEMADPLVLEPLLNFIWKRKKRGLVRQEL